VGGGGGVWLASIVDFHPLTLVEFAGCRELKIGKPKLGKGIDL